MSRRKFLLFAALFLPLLMSASETVFKPGKWLKWPDNGPTVKTVDGVLQFGGNNGHIGFALTPAPQKILKEISFEYRSLESAGGTAIEFHIAEASGESFYCRIKPAAEWRNIVVDPEKLPVFPYGGAKILDGKLDLFKAARVKFNGKFRNNRFEVRNFKVRYETLAGNGERIRRVFPVADYAAPGKWITYDPRKKFTIKTEEDEGKKVVSFDLLNGGGHAGIRFPQLAGYVPETVILKIKAAPENRTALLHILFREQDEESYGRNIKLTPQWQTYRLNLSELPLYRDGGAHVGDKKFNLSAVRFLRFHNYPAGHSFLLGDIEVEYRLQTPEEKAAMDQAKTAFTIKKNVLSRDFERKDRFYPGMGKIKISDGHFVKNGKPVFLLGGWPLDADANPWIMRTNGVDFYVCNANEIYSLYRPKLKNGIPELQWRETPWMHSHINRFLSNKIEFWLEHTSHARYSALRSDRRFREILDAGHMVTYDPFSPAGVEMYKEMFKSYMRYTREYPLFCYELFNEMCYDNTHKISREAFKEAMRKKYGNDISKANKIWGTSFTSFGEVRIPGFMSDDGKNDLPRVELRHREADKHPALYADFHRFQELRCIEAIRKMMPIMRQYDTAKAPLNTVQSHMALNTDHGEHGVTPEALTVSSDFVTHEAGIGFLESDMPSINAVAGMMKPLFFYDAMRYFAQGKPVINGEAPLVVAHQTADPHELELHDLAALIGVWRFYDATVQQPANWTDTGFDDGSWKKINVPGMWGQQGFPKCQIGLYRKKFTISDIKSYKKLYLNGNSIADDGEVYCNGKLAGKSSGFGKKFAIDLTPYLKEGENQLAIRVVNRFFNDNMYYGGLRGQLSVNPVPLVTNAPEPEMEQRHIRGYLWAQVLHGLHGVVICYNAPLFSSAGRIMPFVKKEINNVADILFAPGNLQQGSCAIVYPEETFRLIRHRKYLEKMRGPATLDLMPYYTALRFNGYAPAVIRFKDLAQHASKYRLVIAPDAARISEQDLENLKKFVRDGGTLLTNFYSFTTEDRTHEKLDVQEFTGIQLGKKITTPAKVRFTGIVPAEGYLKKHFLDNSCGREIKLLAAKPLLHAGKYIALTGNSYGKGKVYCITAQAENAIQEKIVRFVTEQTRVKPLLTTENPAGNNVYSGIDQAVFAAGDGSLLIGCSVFGVPGAYRIAPAVSLLSSAQYRVRLTHSGKTVSSPAGKPLWNRKELQNGILLKFSRFDSVVLLLEPENVPARPLSGLSPERLAIAEKLWQREPEKPNAPTVSFSPVSGMERTYGTIPTARKLIADQGFNCRDLVSQKDAAASDIIVWTFPKFPCKFPEKIAEKVRNGGGILLCGSAVLHYHSMNNNSKLFGLFGIAEGYNIGSALYNKEIKLPEFDNMTLKIPVTDKHKILEGVDTVIFSMSNSLQKYPQHARILLRAPANSSKPGAILAVAFEYGKGRVVYVSDHAFLRPGNLERGNNARFLANIMGYLAGKEVKPEQIGNSLFLTTKKLEKAEENEKRIQPMKFPKDTSTYLNRTAIPKGLAGGDPVLDSLKAL